MSSDASRHAATPRLDPQHQHATSSPVAEVMPASPDMTPKLDESPLPPTAEHPPVEQMPATVAAGDVPEAEPPGFFFEDVIHLFHCHLCDKLFKEPVTIPCGKTICKQCIPESHPRSHISFPAIEDRLEGFRCPFQACGKEHTLGDCAIDVTLNKLAGHIRNAVASQESPVVSQPANAIAAQTHGLATAAAPQPSRDSDYAQVTEAEHNSIPHQQPAAGNDPAREDHGSSPKQKTSFAQTQQLTRSELDCQVCYALYHDPLTTGCGHTFCRSCMHRILDHSRYCPLCRRRLSLSPLLNHTSCPSNASLTRIIATLWPDELERRTRALQAEEAVRLHGLETPLFICTLAFPQMPTLLHVFEPKYRLMIRRVLAGNKIFGMVLPRPCPLWSTAEDNAAATGGFYQLGTLLRIEQVQFYEDGRCLIQTVGLSRFRVVRHGTRDGYAVSTVERIDDISLEEEEAAEAAEIAAAAAAATEPSLETMATSALMQLATDFVARWRTRSSSWITDNMLAIYGECPAQDPASFPWWLGSVLPLTHSEKYRLLEAASVRERLKICCGWIIEWETRMRRVNRCAIL